ncbi:MAG: hypothetical protein QM503_12640 [Bacteroidota bacterium]
MNKIVLVLMIAVFFTACGGDSSSNPERTDIISSYANGQPQMERDFKMNDGKRLAVYEREYYEDGNLLKEGPLSINEKRDGLWKSYYRDGVLWSEGEYNNGVREGKTVTYFANGKKYYEGQFVKAQKSGLWKFYNEDGEFVNETIYDTKNKTAITIDK